MALILSRRRGLRAGALFHAVTLEGISQSTGAGVAEGVFVGMRGWRDRGAIHPRPRLLRGRQSGQSRGL
jgi:hypothetical protein